MTLPVVSDLTSPPVVGKMYLVPMIYMARFHAKPAMWWPVHGSLHEDEDIFNFPTLHRHVDQRFLTRAHLRQIGDYTDIRDLGPVERSFATPVSALPGWKHLPEPELRRMRCMREMPLPMMRKPRFAETAPMQKLDSAYAGQTCNKGRLGWVCPHRQYPLGQVSPDAEGILVCPLHGLRIRASDGVVMGGKTT